MKAYPQEQVEAALHQLELHQREITGDSYPYGLQLILASLSTAIHRGDPIKLLNIDPVLEELREEIKNPDYIPGLINELLLQNHHRVTLTLQPDPQLAERQVTAEQQQLADIQRQLNSEQAQEIIQRSQALAARQALDDDPEILPKVSLQDIRESIEQPRSEELALPASNRKLSFYGQATNGLCYQQAVIQLPDLNQELLRLLPIYTSCLTELGIAELDYSQVQTWQSRVSGGVSFFSSIRSATDSEQQASGFLVLSSKALQSNHQAMTELMSRTLHEVRFDEERRVREIIEQICDRKISAITGHGHSLAMTLASSMMSPAARLSHQFGGLEGIRLLKKQREQIKEQEKLQGLLHSLSQIHQLVLASPRQYLAIAEQEYHDHMLADIRRFWDQPQAVQATPAMQFPTSRERLKQAWSVATQVNFCAKAFPTVPSSHQDHAALTVLAGFLRNGYLHRAIREQGGAYGAGADQDANSASFRFYSYRDPRLDDTLQDFNNAVDWILDTDHQPRQLEEAILGVIAGMDKPSSPAGEAKRTYFNNLFGRDLDYLTRFRQRLLAVSMDDLKRVAETWLTADNASVGIVSNKTNLDASQLQDLDRQSL